MKTRVFTVQVLMLCSATVCWASSCSSVDGSGKCGINLDGTNLDEAIAAIMAKVRLVLPEPDNSTGQACASKCWDSEVPGNGSTRNTTAKIDQLIKNINKLTDKLEEEMKKELKKKNLINKVKSFGTDRDWPKLKRALEETLDEGDPALDQVRAVSWTDGKDALMDIVYTGHVELLQKLLDLDLDANLPWGPNNSTMLHAAASAGNKAIAEVLFSRGAIIDAPADFNATPLLRAAASQQPDMVRWLISKGADIHATDIYGWTPLHHAARFGDLETVKVLVVAGVDKEALNEKGHTASDEAADFGHQAVVDYLAPEDPFKTQHNAV